MLVSRFLGGDVLVRNAGKVSGDRFFLTSVFMLAVLTMSVSCLSFCARQDFGSDFRASAPAFISLSGSIDAQRGCDAFLGAADPFYIDIYADASSSCDYEKVVSRHQSEIDRKIARDVESASLHVLRHMLKAYETEYLRSAAPCAARWTGSSAGVRGCRKAIECILPS
jgi:hypothetical protein